MATCRLNTSPKTTGMCNHGQTWLVAINTTAITLATSSDAFPTQDVILT